MTNEVPIWYKQNLTIEEAAKYSNIGETKLREMIKTATIPFAIKVGKKTLINRTAFDKYINTQLGKYL